MSESSYLLIIGTKVTGKENVRTTAMLSFILQKWYRSSRCIFYFYVIYEITVQHFRVLRTSRWCQSHLRSCIVRTLLSVIAEN